METSCQDGCQPNPTIVWTKLRSWTRVDAYRCKNCRNLMEVETERNFEQEDEDSITTVKLC